MANETAMAARGEDVAFVTKVIGQLDEFPQLARQMLIDGLPHSVAGEKRHAFQSQFLSNIRTTLGSAHTASREKQAQGATLAEAARARAEQSRAAEAAAVAAEEAMVSEVAAKEAALAAACAATADAAHEQRESEAEKSGVAEARDKVRKVWDEAADILNGPLRKLREGTMTEQLANDTAAATVQKYLAFLGAEPALVAASPISLSISPEARSAYDEAAVAESMALVQDHTAKLEHVLEARRSEEETAIAVALGMWALADRARERQDIATEALTHAKASLLEATAIRKQASADNAFCANEVSSQFAMHAIEEEKQRCLDQALTAIDRLGSGATAAAGA